MASMRLSALVSAAWLAALAQAAPPPAGGQASPPHSPAFSQAAPVLHRAAQALRRDSLVEIRLAWSVRSPDADPVETRGILVLGPANAFRLTSSELVLVSDGQTVWQYAPANRQVLVQAIARLDPGSMPGALLRSALESPMIDSGAGKIGSRAALRVRLAPTGGVLKRYREIAIYLDRRDGGPLGLEVVDGAANTTVWRIEKIGRAKAKPDLFRFVAPKGVEVVDTR